METEADKICKCRTVVNNFNPNGGHFDSYKLLANCMPIFFEKLNEESFENFVYSATSLSNGICGNQTYPAIAKPNSIQ